MDTIINYQLQPRVPYPWAESRMTAIRAMSKVGSHDKQGLGTFVPNCDLGASPDVRDSIPRTFVLLSVPANVRTVSLERLMGVIFESWTPGQKDPPLPFANGRYISVDKRQWGSPAGRRPQSRRE
jgi:hypothetical protein